MNFEEAIDELNKKIPSGHREVSVRVRMRTDGSMDLICEIYVRGRGVFSGTTFKEVFRKMIQPVDMDLSQLPGDDFLNKKDKKKDKKDLGVDPRQTNLPGLEGDDIPF